MLYRPTPTQESAKRVRRLAAGARSDADTSADAFVVSRLDAWLRDRAGPVVVGIDRNAPRWERHGWPRTVVEQVEALALRKSLCTTPECMVESVEHHWDNAKAAGSDHALVRATLALNL